MDYEDYLGLPTMPEDRQFQVVWGRAPEGYKWRYDQAGRWTLVPRSRSMDVEWYLPMEQKDAIYSALYRIYREGSNDDRLLRSIVAFANKYGALERAIPDPDIAPQYEAAFGAGMLPTWIRRIVTLGRLADLWDAVASAVVHGDDAKLRQRIVWNREEEKIEWQVDDGWLVPSRPTADEAAPERNTGFPVFEPREYWPVVLANKGTPHRAKAYEEWTQDWDGAGNLYGGYAALGDLLPVLAFNGFSLALYGRTDARDGKRPKLSLALEADSLPVIACLQIAELMVTVSKAPEQVRQCRAPGCGAWFTVTHKGRDYCSDACKVRASRARRV